MLKAKTRIKAHVNGEVIEFAIGEEVKGLSAAQVAELKAAGALEDTAELAKEALATGRSLRQLVLDQQLLPPERIERLFPEPRP